jgi:hypothetical protein
LLYSIRNQSGGTPTMTASATVAAAAAADAAPPTETTPLLLSSPLQQLQSHQTTEAATTTDADAAAAAMMATTATAGSVPAAAANINQCSRSTATTSPPPAAATQATAAPAGRDPPIPRWTQRQLPRNPPATTKTTRKTVPTQLLPAPNHHHHHHSHDQEEGGEEEDCCCVHHPPDKTAAKRQRCIVVLASAAVLLVTAVATVVAALGAGWCCCCCCGCGQIQGFGEGSGTRTITILVGPDSILGGHPARADASASGIDFTKKKNKNNNTNNDGGGGGIRKKKNDGKPSLEDGAAGVTAAPSKTARGHGSSSSSFGAWARRYALEWYQQCRETVSRDVHPAIQPSDLTKPRKVVLKARDVLDVFAPALVPLLDDDHCDCSAAVAIMWHELRSVLAEGHRVMGEFLDLDHCHILLPPAPHNNNNSARSAAAATASSAEPPILVERRNRVLTWKSTAFASFQDRHNATHWDQLLRYSSLVESHPGSMSSSSNAQQKHQQPQSRTHLDQHSNATMGEKCIGRNSSSSCCNMKKSIIVTSSSSRFFWRMVRVTDRPRSTTAASVALHQLSTVQAHHALHYLRLVLFLPSVMMLDGDDDGVAAGRRKRSQTSKTNSCINVTAAFVDVTAPIPTLLFERQTMLHNLRKQLRALADEAELFGAETMFGRVAVDDSHTKIHGGDDPKTTAAAVLSAIGTARGMLGKLNDDWTAWQFYREHYDYYYKNSNSTDHNNENAAAAVEEQIQRRACAADAALAPFQQWAARWLIPALEDIITTTAATYTAKPRDSSALSNRDNQRPIADDR